MMIRDERHAAVHAYAGLVNGFDHATNVLSNDLPEHRRALMSEYVVQSGPLTGKNFLDFMNSAIDWWQTELEWLEVHRREVKG